MTDYLRFDELEVGHVLPPVEYEVTPEVVALYRRATLDDATPVPEDPTTRAAAPLTFAAAYMRTVYQSLPNPPGGIHAKQRYVFHAPVFPGDVLTTSGRITDLYVKRDNKYVIVESTTANQDGQVVTSAWATRIWAE